MTIEDMQETELLELGGHWDGGGGMILASAIWWKVFLIPRIRNLRRRTDLGEKVLNFTCCFWSAYKHSDEVPHQLVLNI